MKPCAVLFVCLGNICRSPLAEGIFSHLVAKAGREEQFTADSAGTGGWHAGDGPDRRSVAVAARHGIDISRQRARQVRVEDFARFDLILGMDGDNVAALKKLAPKGAGDRIHLFSDFATGTSKNVPDPWYGGDDSFAAVYTMLFSGCNSLLEKIGADRLS